MAEVAKDLGVDVAEIEARAHKLHEFNPMLGHRGCRLGITYPEIYEMQARAIFEAVGRGAEEDGKTVMPEIMIPLVATRKELDLMKAVVDQVAAEVQQAVGPEARLPGRHHDRAAARRPARRRDRRDGRVLQLRHQRPDADDVRPQPRRRRRRSCETTSSSGILEHDPFQRSTSRASASWSRSPAERGRKARNDLKLGICGEHGGDPASVVFCHKVGLDYVSCSPYRVPIARLAAAQAALGGRAQDGMTLLRAS